MERARERRSRPPARWWPSAAPARASLPGSREAPSFEQIPIHVTAVNFLMAHGAVLEHRRAQIMKRRRHHARNLDRRVRKIGMTLQANEAHVGAHQHPRIRRAVRLVTSLAAFKPHRRVFEGKWTSFVAMAL